MPSCCCCYGGQVTQCCSPAAQCVNALTACNSSGSVAYNPNTNSCSTGGVTNTSANPLPAPDASGGNGSFLNTLQQFMTQGLDPSVICRTEFGLGALNCRLSVAACGQVQPGAAQSPQRGITQTSPSGSALTKLLPLLLLGVAAYVVYRMVD